MTLIRPERPDDIPARWRVNEATFERAAEAELVDALRRPGEVSL
jgi:predicted N-acetyltransferase YhbS